MANVCYVLLIAFGLLIGLAGLWFAYNEKDLASRLKTSGVDTTAEIVKRDVSWSSSRGRRYPTYSVRFRFTVEGADGSKMDYERSQGVNKSNYDAMPEGSQATIRYLPANPQGTGRLSAVYDDSSAASGAMWTGLGFLIGALLLAGVWIYNASATSAQESQAANATAVLVSTARQEWAGVRAVLEPHIPEWDAIKDGAVHRLIPVQEALKFDIPIQEIDYGHCSSGKFYLFAFKTWQSNKQNTAYGDAFGYTNAAQPHDTSLSLTVCTPTSWYGFEHSDFGDGWFFATVFALELTPTPATATPSAQ